MLRFLAPKLPPRTNASHLTTIHLDNGRSQLVFNKSLITTSTPAKPSQYLVTNHLPPAPLGDPNSPNSSLCPPFHIHLKEDETFHVISGTAKFLLVDQQQQDQSHSASTDHDDDTRSVSTTTTATTQDGITSRLAPANTTVTIPQGQIHTFRNGSTSEPLVIEFGFSPPTPHHHSQSTTSPSDRDHDTDHDTDAGTGTENEKALLHAKMHRFFRNTQLYRSDCTAHNLPRAMSQVLLFNYHADVALVSPFLLSLHKRYPLFRGLIERIVAPLLGRVMNLLGGVVLGRWLFGFSPSYVEYYQPVVDSSGTKAGDGLQGRPEDVLCQAWRDHSFDGQSEDWRK